MAKAWCNFENSCLTLDMSHPVWMRVVTGEEWVMTQGTETWAACCQLIGEFRGKLQLIAFAAAPLSSRHLRSWHIFNWHVFMWKNRKSISKNGAMEIALQSLLGQTHKLITRHRLHEQPGRKSRQLFTVLYQINTNMTLKNPITSECSLQVKTVLCSHSAVFLLLRNRD